VVVIFCYKLVYYGLFVKDFTFNTSPNPILFPSSLSANLPRLVAESPFSVQIILGHDILTIPSYKDLRWVFFYITFFSVSQTASTKDTSISSIAQCKCRTHV